MKSRSDVSERRPTDPVARPPGPPQERATDEERAAEAGETLETWRERALRFQADMDNFRKRQRRQAEQRVLADRERLLRSFLSVADDLERALNDDGTGTDGLRQGIDLTHRNLMRLLDREGIEPIQAQGRPFDPARHEALSTVPYQEAGVEPDTVAEVVQRGYRLGDRLLRPARVIVAI
jgi:molecular chaperone GrpE